ncbi:LuxR C-terminal-related transcriptional regulator [Streptomyces sp. NPDC087658]|uniref:helix-turn-helix transcriptional regulator n=1 Tax=Streptomyces sp. NPDC087658 TaxID=3365800 RepID=UPI003820AEA4
MLGHASELAFSPSEPPPMSVALVSQYGLRPVQLSGFATRLVTEPWEIRSSDDVVLFHGTDMARNLVRFLAGAEAGLPPVAVLAPWLDWDDVSAAFDHGAVSYLLENQYACFLDEALRCAAHGASMLDPWIAAEQVRIASRARAGARAGTGARTTGGEGGRARPEAITTLMATPITKVPPAAVVPPAVTALEGCSRLSERECRLMDLLASGRDVHDIARGMFLSEKTVRNYLSRIYKKLDVHSQTEAILRWLGHLKTPLPG